MDDRETPINVPIPERGFLWRARTAFVLHKIGKVLRRLIVFLGATVLISVVYKGLIDSGVFLRIRNERLLHIVFSVSELLLLAGYWHGVFLFSGACQFRTRTPMEYYLFTTIVFVLFNAVYWTVYLKDRDVFLWVFRVTLNLFGVRMLGSVPENFLPYMIAFLAVTYLIMMTEPFISRKMYESWERKVIEQDERL